MDYLYFFKLEAFLRNAQKAMEAVLGNYRVTKLKNVATILSVMVCESQN